MTQRQKFSSTYILPEIQDIVLDYLAGDVTGKLKKTNKSNEFNFFNNESKLRPNIAAYHAVRGEQNQLKAMLNKNPEFLLIKSRVIDYSGRTIEGTVFQIALGADDVEMCEMIGPYFKRLVDGQAEKLKQHNKQFPKDKKEDDSTDLLALHKVIRTISDSKAGDPCDTAIKEFKNYLDSKLKNVIKTGKHFNVQLLVEAFRLYDENYEHFGGSWNSSKNILCWRHVLGYIQRFLPACYAQALCQGVYYLEGNKEKFDRRLRFRYGGEQYYPLDAKPSFRLGYDYAAWATEGWWTRAGGACQAGRGAGWHSLKKYAQQKRYHCENLCNVKNANSNRAKSD